MGEQVVTSAKLSSAELRAAETKLLTRLYERYRRQVFQLALRYGGGRVGWAEDVTHDVFTKLVGQSFSLVEVEDLDGWFYRVTTRRCLNRLRHERFAQSAPVSWLLRLSAGTVPTPETRALVSAELRQVAEALEHLPPKERVAVQMRFIDEKDVQEIADVLGHSKGYVSKLLTRAVESLRQLGVEATP